MTAGKKPLKLVRSVAKNPFSAAFNNDQWGYQMVDDTKVVERTEIPVEFKDGKVSNRTVVATLYDFTKYEITTTSVSYLNGSEQAASSTVTSIPFSQLEGKEALFDARRALQELGGTPPRLDDISKALGNPRQAIQAPKTATFKQRQ